MGVNYVTNQGDDGNSFGYDTDDLISFYGVTPVTQRSGATQAKVSTTAISAVDTTAITPVTTSAITAVDSTAIMGYGSTWGFTTSTAAGAWGAAINAIITRQALTYTAANLLVVQGAALVAAANSTVTQSAANMVLTNELRASLVALGAIAGA